ncbi:hypothetical protein L5515_019213 [Caenorhabditis briggsae]|uniref:PPM-type phosphatase domain-containing protein n=1 Tax=Caenorhabditis briggsae TaxID=6238 RepID=A0AAE9JTK2_CAEBR|nr:hypothetical protein L5515_019213 [Caenorhabditis briggsae]
MEDGFVDQYTANTDAGIGTVHSCRYSKQKKPVQNNDFLSCSTSINNGHIKLYGIFSGFNGGDYTAKFVMNRLVYELFQENPISPTLPPLMVCKEFRRRFENTAERYLLSNADALNERLLKMEDHSEAGKNAVSEINQKIRQGTTALVVLIINQDLYVLNCGSGLAIAMNSENPVQLNTNLHDKDNVKENQRIRALGIDPDTVLNPTRAIGDLQRTHLFEETEAFKNAKGPPVISTPDVQYFRIDPAWRHIVLLSDGVVQNLKEVEVENIPTEVSVRLIEDHTLTSTAQALADSFARKHLDAFITMNDDKNCFISNHREEMTVIYVKLPEINAPGDFYETVDSAFSTMESTNATMADPPSRVPYVDAVGFYSGPNFTEMKRLITMLKKRK